MPLRVFAREVRTLITLFFVELFARKQRAHPFCKKGHGKIVVLIPGFISPPKTFARAERLLRRSGYRTLVLRVRHMDGWERVVRQIKSQVFPLLVEGENVIVIGHSLGGAVGYIFFRELLAKHPSMPPIKKLVMMGTPVSGSPWRPLVWLVKMTTGICPLLFEALNRTTDEKVLKKMRKKIVVVASGDDGIAPFAACEIDGVTCIDVQEIAGKNVDHFRLAFCTKVWKRIIALL